LVLANFVDLSVGSIAVLSSVIFGQAMQAELGLGPACALGMVIGTLWGVLNGYLIAYLDFSPIIVTLGGLAGARGVSELITHDYTVFGFGNGFALLGNGMFLDMPVPVWIYAVILIIGLHIWYQTPWGRHMVAIGGARDAAKALGIRWRATAFWLY